MEPQDLERVRTLYLRVRGGTGTDQERLELREVLSHYSRHALDLPWWAIVDAADYALAISASETDGAQVV